MHSARDSVMAVSRGIYLPLGLSATATTNKPQRILNALAANKKKRGSAFCPEGSLRLQGKTQN